MSEVDQFQQYAEEALLWVAQSKTQEEKRLLLELARTWRKAAIVSAAVVSGIKRGQCRDLMKARNSAQPTAQGRTPTNWPLN
jgi:hypothetical protein